MPSIGAASRLTFSVKGLSSHTWVTRFAATEGISELFEVELVLTSDDRDISFAQVVGKPALFMLETDQSAPRHIHGMVSRFRRDEEGKKLSVYRATLVPKLWRLQHRHDARIFQGKSVPEILAEVLEGGGVTDRRVALTRSYAPREYCVQYRESDFAFVSRLMEEEGIYYFFEHSEDKHVMVLADAPSGPTSIAGPDTLAYKGTLGAMAHGESVSRFSSAEEVRVGKVSLTDYNFKKPGLSLSARASASLDSDLEMYDYPGEYELPGDGTTLSKVRLEEQQARRAVAEGESGCIRMTPGYLFTLSDHPRDSENQTYLLTSVRHRGSQAQMVESEGADGTSYANEFLAIPSNVPYRPERRTPRPTIKGVQTAIVTGPGGEEVYTDPHGRVKVHFHWDRKGSKDDKSSCWIRVSQLWAGAGWGAMWIPRVGHEVVVDFIEGDPDRPLIVGRVYHGANVPPYPLPGEKTKSTIKSNSSPGGGGSNEFRFEDRAGAEEIYLHGQKDWNIKIEHDKGQIIGHDEALDVGHDRQKHVKHDQRERVDHNKKIQVGNDHVENIDGNATIHVGKDHTESIDGKESLTIGKTRDVTVSSDQKTTIGGSHTVTVSKNHDETIMISMALNVGASKAENVGGASSESVGGMKSVKVGAAYSTGVGGAMSTSVGGNQSTSVSKDQTTDVEGEKHVTVGKKVVVMCGEASITLEKDGKITVSGKDLTVTGTGDIRVKGKNVNVKADGKVNVDASGNVTVKGSKVAVN